MCGGELRMLLEAENLKKRMGEESNLSGRTLGHLAPSCL
jgi:hypothetical protein